MSTTQSTASSDIRPEEAASLPKLSLASWAIYDMADSIFSMNIGSVYFPLWFTGVLGGTAAQFGYANSLAMLFVFLTAPMLGAVSDQAGRRLPFLIVSAVLCMACTAWLGTGGLTTSLILFALASYFHQTGFVFYNTLLPSVSTVQNRGLASGIGIALSNLGMLLAVGSGLVLLERIGHVNVFRFTAVAFLLLASPCFVLLKESGKPGLRLDLSLISSSIDQLRQSVRHVRDYTGLVRFLVGRFFYMEAVTTIFVFMAIYVTQAVGFSETAAQLVMLEAIGVSILAGVVWGYLVDRVGPQRVLHLAVLVLGVMLVGAASVPAFGLPGWLFWIVAALAGVAISGTACSERPLLLMLTPPQYVGQFFGLNSLVGRFSSIFGPLLWALMTGLLGLPQFSVLIVLAAFAFIALMILRKVSDHERQWSREQVALDMVE